MKARVWQLFEVCQHEFANLSLPCEGRLRVLRPRHTMRQIVATGRSVDATSRLVCTASATSRCDKTFVLGTQANLEEGKCELVPNLTITILLVVALHSEEEETCSGCLFWSTCSVAIFNGFLRDHGKIIDAPSLVDFNFVAAICRRSVHTCFIKVYSIN